MTMTRKPLLPETTPSGSLYIWFRSHLRICGKPQCGFLHIWWHPHFWRAASTSTTMVGVTRNRVFIGSNPFPLRLRFARMQDSARLVTDATREPPPPPPSGIKHVPAPVQLRESQNKFAPAQASETLERSLSRPALAFLVAENGEDRAQPSGIPAEADIMQKGIPEHRESARA